MKNVIFILAVLALSVTSCVPVTSRNTPGKTLNEVPKTMKGKYELVYPSELGGLMEGEQTKTYVSFQSDGFVFHGEDGQDELSKLNDSLFISKIGKQLYISMGHAPDLTVLKVVKKGKDFELYPMYSSDMVTIEDLSQYFTDVEEVLGESDEEGNEGISSFVVTIKDDKLDDYFKSNIPSKDPFKLIRVKN